MADDNEMTDEDLLKRFTELTKGYLNNSGPGRRNFLNDVKDVLEGTADSEKR